MKVIKCTLIDDIPKHPLMHMFDGTEEQAVADFVKIFGREPKIAYLLNGIYWCVIEPRKEE